MRIDKCSFCGGPAYPGHGSMFVRNDSKIFRFCRSKCRKAFFKKKNPLRTKWTKAYRTARGKEMTMDTTFEFEKRRNAPERYDREKIQKTVEVMKIVDEIKDARQKRFYQERMKEPLKLEKEHSLKDLVDGVDLIVPPMMQKESLREEMEGIKERVKTLEKERATKKKQEKVKRK